jgi:hypothetical protein
MAMIKFSEGYTALAKRVMISSAGKKPKNAPKKSGAYMLFTQDVRDEVVQSLPAGSKLPEVAREMGARWKVLSEAEKSKFKAIAAERNVQYEIDMAAFVPDPDEFTHIRDLREKVPLDLISKKVTTAIMGMSLTSFAHKLRADTVTNCNS